MVVPINLKTILEKQQYRIVGNHSSVKICHWTKKSLTEGKVCYKEKWYQGVKSHRCMQLSTATFWCSQKCIWCWRLQSGDRPDLTWKENVFESELDEPKEILDGCIEARKNLLTGFFGNAKVDKKKWKEAVTPSMVAISLTGESLLFPRISEFIQDCHKRKLITFLVTNGTLIEQLEKILGSAEPTQLYITLPAPDKQTYIKSCRPLISDGWERLKESLELMPSFKCNKVIRLTLVNGLNFHSPEKYAKLIKKTDCDFIEAKSYSWVGTSRQRLPETAVVPMEKIREFAKTLAEQTGYKIEAEDEQSKVFLLKR